MEDNYLYKKIAEDIFEICKNNGILKVMYIEICVSENSRINENNLLNKLIDEIPELVDFDMKIKINRQLIENMQILIKTVDGIIKEKMSD